jgi:hypothetical protein
MKYEIIKVDNIQQLLDLIDDSEICHISEKAGDYFIINAPNNATWQILFEENDKIENIILKTIEQLKEFDADERFTEYWSKEFAKHNGFTPLQFITMLKKDEEMFRHLAKELSKMQLRMENSL